MASTGSGNRSGGGSRGQSGKGSGRSGAKGTGSGNRNRPAAAATATKSGSAAERARDRAQGAAGRGGSGNRGSGRPQSGGRRPSGRQNSTARTAGIFGGILVVLAVVVIVIISLLGTSAPNVAGPHDPYIAARPAPANIVSAVANVPTSELAAAGSGSGISTVGAQGSGAALVKLTGKALTSGGKPEIVYLGSEYCPYCAATRWPLTIALSKFGTFSGLETTASTPLDIFPSTHTLSYAKAKYTSKYLVFNPTEELSNDCNPSSVVRDTSTAAGAPAYVCNNGDYKQLETPSKLVQQLATKYDSATYFGASSANGIPFIDFGGKYVEDGAIYTPTLLANANWSQIVNSFKVPTQGIGQGILGATNKYTAMICKMTGNKPGSVCNASYVKSIEKSL